MWFLCALAIKNVMCMPVYVEFRDAVSFSDFIHENGVYESLIGIIDTLGQGVAENFNHPTAVIKKSSEHDKEAEKKQVRLFCSWALNIQSTLMHMEYVSFCRAIWEGDSIGAEGLKTHFIMEGVNHKAALKLASQKVDVEKFYMTLMQCNLILKQNMIHEKLNESLVILGVPPLPEVLGQRELDESRYYDALDQLQILSNSPVPEDIEQRANTFK